MLYVAIKNYQKYKKRYCYSQIDDYLNNEYPVKLLILYGLRRTGKSTLIYQALNDLSIKEFAKSAYIKCENGNTIKELLLDQSIINGFGNIYVDEVLFASNIKPNRLGNKITLKECDKIRLSSKEIITKATECGGTTIRSYTSSLGVEGTYQNYLMVHTKAKEPCKVCGTIIEKTRVGGRGTYFCKKCQK